MPPNRPPEGAIERQFVTLARKLRFVRGFGFVVIFIGDGRASLQLRTRLAASLEAQGRGLVVVAPSTPAKLVSQGLSGIFEAAAGAGRADLRIVVWLEAFRGFGDPDWDDQRRLLLSRMNERRSRLESELAGPLVLLLPEGAQRDAAMLAPDMWHVRLHSEVVVGVEAPAPVFSSPPPSLANRPEPPAEVGDVPEPRTSFYWKSELNKALAADPDALDALSIADGVAAVEALQQQGQMARALESASTLATLARRRMDRVEADDRERATLELATVLRLQGEALASVDRREEALVVLNESVALFVPFSDAVAKTVGSEPVRPFTIRATFPAALQASLTALGNVQLASRDAPGAVASYSEALALTGPAAGVASSSNRVSEWVTRAKLSSQLGDALSAARRPDEALVSYEFGIAAWREAVVTGRRDARVMRDLALALAHLGDVRWSRRQGELALRDYREALDLLRLLQAQRPEEASGLETLCGLLATIGRVEQESGRIDEALAAYTEGLAMARRFLDLHGHEDAANVIRQLAMPLQRIAVAREMAPSTDPPDADRHALALAGADALRTRVLTGALHAALGAALDDPSQSRELLDAAIALASHLRGAPTAGK